MYRNQLWPYARKHRRKVAHVIIYIIIAIVVLEVLWIGIYFLAPTHPQTKVSSARIMRQIPKAKSNINGDRTINQLETKHLEATLNRSGVSANRQINALRRFRNLNATSQQKWDSEVKGVNALMPGEVKGLLLDFLS